VLRFFDAIEPPASHIYESALPMSPSSSLVRARYLNQVSTNVNFSVVDDAWDACIRTIRSQREVFSAVFSHKDDLVAVGEEDIVEIFDAATGQRRATLMTNYIARPLSFSSDDNILASGDFSADIGVDVWDLQTGGHIGTFKGHTKGINSIKFSPCGNMIATCSNDCTIQIWDSFSLDCRFFMEGHPKRVSDICWSGSGSKVISGSWDETVKVWSVSDEQCSQTLTIPTGGPVNSVAFSPDSTLIAAASEDGMVKVFDAGTGDVLHTIAMDLKTMYSIRFLNRDQITCLTKYSGKFGIWDITSAEVSTFKCEGLGCALSSDGTRILSRESHVVNIWQTDMPIQNQDVAQDTPIQNQDVAQDTPIQNKRHRTKPMRKMLEMMGSAFTFSHRKDRAETSQESQATSRHAGEVTDIAFSKDGQLMVSGSWDGMVNIWDTSTGQCLTTFRGHLDRVLTVILSPNLRLCASWGFDDVIRIWNVRTRKQVSTYEHRGRVCAMCFSQSGNQLVSLSYSNMTLWDVTTEHRLASMNVEREKFTDISFGIDGTGVILKGDRSDEIQRWKISANTNQTDNSTTPLPQLPMVFLPVQDAEPRILPDTSPHQYHLDERSSWVLDNQNRRML
jgi:WD40 repeat protein